MKTKTTYTKKTKLGLLTMTGEVVYEPLEPGDIPAPLETAYSIDCYLDDMKFAEIGIVQATKDANEGFTADPRNAVLYCDGQSAELGELAWQMFQNSVDRPKMPVDTFIFPETLGFVKAQPELAAECVMGIFKIQHDLDKKILHLHRGGEDSCVRYAQSCRYSVLLLCRSAELRRRVSNGFF